MTASAEGTGVGSLSPRNAVTNMLANFSRPAADVLAIARAGARL